MERQLIHAPEQPAEGDPVVSGENIPRTPGFRPRRRSGERRSRFFPAPFPHHLVVGEPSEGSIGSPSSSRPRCSRIEFSTVFCDQPDADQVNGVRPFYEFGIDPIFHGSSSSLLRSRLRWGADDPKIHAFNSRRRPANCSVPTSMLRKNQWSIWPVKRSRPRQNSQTGHHSPS